MTQQSKIYAREQNIGRVAELPAVDVPSDLQKTRIDAQGVTLEVTPDGVWPVEQQTAVAIEDAGGTVLDLLARRDLPLGVEQQTPVGIEDTTGSQVDPATEESLTSTLSREIASWTAGVLTVTDDGSFAISAWNAGTLPVEQQSPVVLEDTGGTSLNPLAQRDVPLGVTPTDSAEAYADGAAVGSGGEHTETLQALGAERLVGTVVRKSTTYDVEVRWQDDAGTTLFTDTVAQGVAAGTETDLDEPMRSANAVVAVVDAGGASGAVDAVLHAR